MKRAILSHGSTESVQGIDAFRYVAAVLIIMIHTSPLESVNEIADFILTREIARVAVPFFLMISGYYVAYRFYVKSTDAQQAMIHMVRKLGIIYISATIVYLPVRIYSGYFNEDINAWKLVRDVLFDGTFYHLWYLPAAMLGISLVYLMSKRLSIRQSFLVSIFLYVIGLFGDSYYGVIEKTLIGDVYEGMFHIFSYTRNGIFFAPIFLILGVLVRERVEQEKEEENDSNYDGIIFVISFVGLIVEGLILYVFQVQRHDSMYLMLLPVMYSGYRLLLKAPLSRGKFNRKIAMLVYLIHPFVIVIVRMAAKGFRIEKVLIENQLVLFLCVTLVSFLLAWGFNQIMFDRKKDKVISREQKPRRAWVEINLDNLTSNIRTIQGVLKPKTEIMGVVKANAYGHGDVIISRHLNQLGINAFAVATLQEAIHLRKNGIRGVILILGYTPANQSYLLEKYHLTQTVFDIEYADELNSYGKKLSVHIKIDTGMHRLGENSHNIERICEIFEETNLKVDGMFTHLCAADSRKAEDVAFTKKQMKEFYAVVDEVKQKGYHPGKIHLQSSYGLLNYPELECDYVRIGIAMYGVFSNKKDETVLKLPLEPVLSVKSCIVMTKEVHKGESVGYGRQYVAEKDMRIAVVAIGYADGISRRLSCGTGKVLVRGKKADIIGRICMDQMMLDVTEIPEAKAEDEVAIIGTDGTEQILVEDIAESTNTITNEILSRLGYRLPRIAKKSVME